MLLSYRKGNKINTIDFVRLSDRMGHVDVNNWTGRADAAQRFKKPFTGLLALPRGSVRSRQLREGFFVMAYKAYFQRFDDKETPFGVGERPSDERIRQRIADIETFMERAREDNYHTLKAARDELRAVLGEREGRTLNCGTLHYDRTSAEMIMDVEYHMRGNRRIDKGEPS